MRRRFTLVFPAICALSACSQTLPRRPADDRAHEAWIEPALGRAADVAIVVRMKAIREDATYRALMKRDKIDLDPSLLHLLLDSDELTLEAIAGKNPKNPSRGAQWLLVVRGVPGDLSPQSLESEGHALFQRIGETTGGAIELASDTKAAERLLVYPDRTWVFAPRSVAARLETSSTPPPPLHFDEEALFAMYFGGGFFAFAREQAPEHHALYDGIEFSTDEVDAPAGDTDVVVVSRNVYRDDEAAKGAELGMHKTLDLVSAELSKSDVDGWIFALVRARTSISREGRIVTAQVRVPRFLVEKGVGSAQ